MGSHSTNAAITGGTRRPDVHVRDLLAAAAIGVVAGAGSHFYGRPVAGDDTFIYMRYVANALGGNGFVFNIHESSYGVTSPLWMLAMTPIAYVFGNTVEVWKMAGVVLTGLAGSLLFGFLRQLRVSLPWAVLLTGVVVIEPHTFRWSSSGMEGAAAKLALIVATWCFWRVWYHQDRGPSALLGVTLGFLPFIRPELALFSAGVLSALLALRSRRVLAVVLATAATAAGLCVLVTWRELGGIIPQTASAKAILLRQVNWHYGLVTSVKILASGAAGALLVVAWLRGVQPWIAWWRVVTLGAVAASVGYLAYQNQLVSTRYATYLSLPVVLAGVLICAETIVREGGASRVIRWFLCLQVLASLAMLTYLFPVTRIAETRQIQEFAEAVRRLVPGDSRIAMSEIGAFGFYSELYIVDTVGLTDRATLRWAQEHGRPATTEDLERLLLSRRATHFVDTFSSDALMKGTILRFTRLADTQVQRDNFTRGVVVPDRWRIYRVEPR